MLKTGAKVRYEGKEYLVLDKTPDGFLIIGNGQTVDDEISEEDVIVITP